MPSELACQCAVLMTTMVAYEYLCRLKQERDKEWVVYNPPLMIPPGPAFSLDHLDEVYCVEFFRFKSMVGMRPPCGESARGGKC
jgi:hypothetical protein